MRPNELVLRCFAEVRDGAWQAICIDLGLAAQGDSLAEVRQKLDAQVKEYVSDALGGVDREHAGYLLRRKSPFYLRARYWRYRFLAHFHGPGGDGGRTFGETLPLVPAR